MLFHLGRETYPGSCGNMKVQMKTRNHTNKKNIPVLITVENVWLCMHVHECPLSLSFLFFMVLCNFKATG